MIQQQRVLFETGGFVPYEKCWYNGVTNKLCGDVCDLQPTEQYDFGIGPEAVEMTRDLAPSTGEWNGHDWPVDGYEILHQLTDGLSH